MVKSIPRKMEARFMRGDASVKPTVSTYTTVIKAWMRSREIGSTRRTPHRVHRQLT